VRQTDKKNKVVKKYLKVVRAAAEESTTNVPNETATSIKAIMRMFMSEAAVLVANQMI
jgi:hypothetical protein